MIREPLFEMIRLTLVALCLYMGRAGGHSHLEDSAGITFGTPTLLGNNSASRVDPELLTFPSTSWSTSRAVALGASEEDGTPMYKVSSDGGVTWTAAPDTVAKVGSAGWAVGVTGSKNYVTGSVYDIPAGYVKTVTAGPWSSKGRYTYSWDGQNIVVAEDVSTNSSWSATEHDLGLLAFVSGGVTALDNSGKHFLATVWIWYADSPILSPGSVCCNGSVVAYTTNDGGQHWQFASTIASKQSIQAQWPSEEGPNENDVVMLKDGKTLLCVMRIDGGDGVPHHQHVPYVFAKSTDMGKSWTLTRAPPALLSARPRALVLPNGALIIAGGRPALNMWVSPDGSGDSWDTIDIPSVHNSLVTDPALQYCEDFENATMSLGWEQSSCYNQLGVLDNSTGLICYERQGAASGGNGKPPLSCHVGGSQIFCMRFTVTPP